MRAIVQRVNSARLSVDDQQIARIGPGLLVYVSVAEKDNSQDCQYLSQKIIGLRIFNDPAGRLNLDILQTGGQVLLVSNFTLPLNLTGDVRRNTILK